jgi:hypothetical protein
VTLERRKAAEERKRLEELKAQVRVGANTNSPRLTLPSSVLKKQRDYGGKLVVPRRSHIDHFRWRPNLADSKLWC